jgi:methylmalonyl-CoA epimerase
MTTVTLNHIGIAVTDLPGMKKLFALLGVQAAQSEDVPEQGVRVHFLPLPKTQTNLELLEVRDQAGTVAKSIQKRGPGVHHLSFQVEKGKLDGLCKKLRDEDYRLTYDSPKIGAHQMRINFIHPASAGGVLVELMEAGG